MAVRGATVVHVAVGTDHPVVHAPATAVERRSPDLIGETTGGHSCHAFSALIGAEAPGAELLQLRLDRPWQHADGGSDPGGDDGGGHDRSREPRPPASTSRSGWNPVAMLSTTANVARSITLTPGRTVLKFPH